MNWIRDSLVSLTLALGLILTPAKADDLNTIIDFGGSVIERITMFDRLEETGVTIPVGGVCISACTMFLGLSNVCVMPRSVFGFHSAYFLRPDGTPEMSDFGNAILMAYYPEEVGHWVEESQSLKSLELTFLTSKDLWELGLPRCNDEQDS